MAAPADVTIKNLSGEWEMVCPDVKIKKETNTYNPWNRMQRCPTQQTPS
jgi:hypothetical protein